MTPDRIKNAAALTKLTKMQHFEMMARNKKDTFFCFEEKKKKPYFINSHLHQSELDFLRYNVPTYKMLADVDLQSLLNHPHLKEVYCGDLHRVVKSNQVRFYFTLRDEQNIAIDKVATIYRVLKSQLRIPDSKLYYAFVSDDLFNQNRRKFIARGLPVRNFAEVHKATDAKTLAAKPLAGSSENVFSVDSQVTEARQIEGSQRLSEKEYGVLAARGGTSGELSLYLPFAVYEFILREKVDAETCSAAKSQCHERHGNSCQLAHGQCLTLTMQRRRPTLADLFAHLSAMQIFKDPTPKNKDIRAGVIGFAGSLVRQMQIDNKLMLSYQQQINSAFPGTKTLAFSLSSNVREQEQNPEVFAQETYYCPGAQLTEKCRGAMGASGIAEALLKTYANAFAVANFSQIGTAIPMQGLGFAIRIREAEPDYQLMGYVYIHPDYRTRSFNLKLVNVDAPGNTSVPASEPFYVSINSENKIIKGKDYTRKKALTKRSVGPLSERDLEQVIVNVKKEYLNQLVINKESEKRLYTFKYLVDQMGNTTLRRN